mmetsp:Transcript_9400/g.16670  ORF Transcript_9400/g.16670 Transcript_9400/m.16670 type:complete len:490 (-) Transcript_9400:116-1585(-)|eukprot:CAMPEP_0197653178 /NCGR_PEP_ID=MMETSP1338-20131121/34904_1 /TAXON_ID=43686 ORGANISM="Pelagodinium beii, Strain RCC1491" /NCGR_SAMPLE_ID=MMETSP1338 /ASSEMBLY_ACC=CAM_ASM_000754 /LENGTH=489 /DNA_ID=CAMNT_0043228213 /DNA_START=41 /DNA_END=1510 /DNA_ORIENTATION=+
MPQSSPQQERSPLGSLEAENELRQFLKIARPDWSKPRRTGRNDVARVIAKLKAIGITDVESLIQRVETNTINEELFNNNFIPLSREALDSMRKQRAFFQGLDSVDVPNVRQVGAFDPVAQMLSRRRLARAVTSAGRSSSPSRDRRSEDRSDGFGGLHRNNTAPGGLRRADLERFATSTPPLSAVLGSAGSIASMSGTASQVGAVRLRGAKNSSRGRHRRLPAMSQPIQALAAPGAEMDGGSLVDEGSPRSVISMSPRPRNASSSKFSVTWSTGSVAGHSVEMEGSDAGGERPVAEKPEKGAGRTARSLTAGSLPTVTDFGNSRSLGQSRQTLASITAMTPVRADTPTSEELLSLQRENHRILREMEDPGRIAAKWSQRSIKTPLEQGEDMLKEAQALDDRERLVRQVKAKSGPADPFRSHIAQNIKMRLRDEEHQRATEGLAINQQCMNIRKQLASMVNARKELTGLRVKVEKVWEEPQLQATTMHPLA